jgi:hypothetical protein
LFDASIGPDASPQYPTGSESELTRRLARAGYKAWHCQGAVVEHIIRPSQLTQQWILQRARSGTAEASTDCGQTSRPMGPPP